MPDPDTGMIRICLRWVMAGMTVNEDRAHFSMWCMLAAPLMAGNDLTNMSDETHDILTNPDAIAIDQDPLGIEGFKFAVK